MKPIILIFVTIMVLINMSENASSFENPIAVQIKSLVEQEWKSTIAHHLSEENGNKITETYWESRISPPLPAEWPIQDNKLIFYAYARGRNMKALRDGEYVGKVWAKVTFDSEPKLILISKKLSRTDNIVGVRPLKAHEIAVLNSDPIELLRSKKSEETDKKIKSYYCLQKSLGNLPSEIENGHISFFKWLACST